MKYRRKAIGIEETVDVKTDLKKLR